jgi:WD40 repeat protein
LLPSLSTDAQRVTATNLAQIDQPSQLQKNDVVRRYLVHRSTLFCSPAAWETLCEFLVASRLLLLSLLLFKYFDVRAIATQPAREGLHAPTATAGAPAKMATASSGSKAVRAPPRTLAAPPSVCLVTQNSSHADLCCCDLSDTGSSVALGRSDGAIQLCRLSRSEALQSRFGAEPAELPSRSREVHGHGGPVYSVATSFDQQHVLSGSQDGTVRLWSWHHAACLAAYANHSFPVWHVAFASHHAQFLSSCYDGGLRLFDTQRLTPLRLMAGHLSDVTAARFHRSDAYAVSASHDGTLRLWDVSSSGCVRLLLGHTGPVTDVAVTARAEVAASASLDQTVRVWDLGSGRARAALPHGEPVSHVVFSSDGQLLASVGARRIRVWRWEAAGCAGSDAEPLLSCDSPVMLLGATFMTDSPLLLACGLGEDPILSILT